MSMKTICKLAILVVSIIMHFGNGEKSDVWMLNKDYMQLEYCKQSKTMFVGLTFNGKTVDILDVENKNISRTFNVSKEHRVYSLSVTADCSRVVLVTDKGIVTFPTNGSQNDLTRWNMPPRGITPLPEWQFRLGRGNIGYGIQRGQVFCVNVVSGEWRSAKRRLTNLYNRISSLGPTTNFITLHPNRAWVYFGSSSTLYKFNITSDCAVYDYQVRSTGEQLHVSQWFYSNDASQVFLNNGKVVNITGVRETDMFVRGKFSSRTDAQSVRTPNVRRPNSKLGWFDQSSKQPHAIYRIIQDDPNITVYS